MRNAEYWYMVQMRNDSAGYGRVGRYERVSALPIATDKHWLQTCQPVKDKNCTVAGNGEC